MIGRERESANKSKSNENTTKFSQNQASVEIITQAKNRDQKRPITKAVVKTSI